MLAPNPEPPEVTQTSMRSDLLQSLQVVSQFAVNTVREDLRVFAINDVLLSIEEPSRNFILRRVLNDGHNPFKFVGVKVARALAQVNIGFLAHQIRIPPPNTLDLRERVHYLTFTVHIGVQQTQDVLELLVGLRKNEGHLVLTKITK